MGRRMLLSERYPTAWASLTSSMRVDEDLGCQNASIVRYVASIDQEQRRAGVQQTRRSRGALAKEKVMERPCNRTSSKRRLNTERSPSCGQPTTLTRGDSW